MIEQVRNKDQKCPVVFLLDTSGSMDGAPINELNNALTKLKDEILCEPILANRLEIGIVAFDDEARIERPIDLISGETVFPTLSVGGLTNLVSGMNLAISIIEDRKAFYKSNNEQYYRPFIVLITDGAPTNTTEEIEALDVLIQSKSDEKRFIFLPFGTEDADLQLLAKINAQTADQRLKREGMSYLMKNMKKCVEVFQFVSASIATAMSSSTPTPFIVPSNVAQSKQFIDLSN
jgi:uncharacterized protein YegL